MGVARCHYCATMKEMKDLKRCANCKSSFYCSKECQRLHWKVAHKALCMIHVGQPGKHLKEDPDEKAKVKKFNRWVTAWSHAMTACSTIALDLANHQWGRHETHTLVLTVEHTDLKEDARLFRVTEATIRSYADVIKLVPQIERAVTCPPSERLAEWFRSCCIIFVKDKDDPTKNERVRVHACRAPSFRNVYSDMDKDWSRGVAEVAIPLLVSEINGSTKPEEALRKFHLMVGGPDEPVQQPSLEVWGMGNTDEGEGELLRQCFEQLLNGDGKKNRGFGS